MKRPSFPSMASCASRRMALGALSLALFAVARPLRAQIPEEQIPNDRKQKLPELEDDPRLPDGKSQKNAIAKEKHAQSLKDADELVAAAEELRDELKRSGMFVVPLNSVKKTEEIEKLAKRIRGRLKS